MSPEELRDREYSTKRQLALALNALDRAIRVCPDSNMGDELRTIEFNLENLKEQLP